jgi:succinate dehydrogenase / fumarate reductase membrane anchor subunit
MATHHPHKTLIAPLGRARGLGSAKRGLGPWWAQRVTAVALLPLSLWFVWSVVRLAGADQGQVIHWLSRPASAILMALLVIALFYHLSLGAQVIVEDYIHRELPKITALLLINGLIVLTAAAALFTILHVAVGGQ